MNGNRTWTADDARENFSSLLENARTAGPQRIRSEKGIFVLCVEDDFSKKDAAELLLERRPKGKI
ncbi:hypothetical protein ELG88_08430 [Rhizobium leguminosarum]|uniref:hypothetical protein n=1 Tax=Rhizobium leguminosarum TaxID=384 RepID=UPI001031CF14|nr:hypothetical protein [Rhizobium leguminosarum]TBF35240.1 hypothetical protein ELG88_08430 [Rhizobium leguminosarum]